MSDWRDKDDDLTPAIKGDSLTDGYFARYDRAMGLVGNRHSKGALVALVSYLLREGEAAPTVDRKALIDAANAAEGRGLCAEAEARLSDAIKYHRQSASIWRELAGHKIGVSE